MADNATPCRRCETAIGGSARYCPSCGAPQTEAAADELIAYVKEEADLRAADGGSASIDEPTARERLRDRGLYVVGYATVVAGLATMVSVGSVLLVLAGVAVLPPARKLLGRPLDGTFKWEFMAAIYGVVSVLGVGLLWLL